MPLTKALRSLPRVPKKNEKKRIRVLITTDPLYPGPTLFPGEMTTRKPGPPQGGLGRLIGTRSSCKRNTARRKRPARTPETRRWRHLLPANTNPAVVENRIRATDQRTRDLESRLIMLLKEQEELPIKFRALTRGA